MKAKLIAVSITFILLACAHVRAQQNAEQRVPLAEQAAASDADGRTALAARLRTTDLRGALDSPVTNVRLVIENRSQFFYNYVSGWATFYDAEGVRCGEGLFKLDALATGEAAETDTPGLRLTCAPATWRIVATNLLTRSTDVAKPNEPEPAPDSTGAETSVMAAPLPDLEINVDGRTLPLQLGNPIEINTRRKSKVRIVVNTRP
ncbi:MAG: hypothetical protein JO360_09615 [Acidobacteria bacterium]|nr:hypothetical protein [Acidobacteriota bacterium]